MGRVKKPNGSQIIKINLHKLTKPDRPFDTSFYLMGAGLINGEGFPSSLNTILDVYDFDQCKKNSEIILFGSINKNKLTDYISKSLYAKIKLKSVDQFINTFGQVKLTVDAKTSELKKYRFGSKGKTPVTYIVLKNVINQSLNPSEFTYNPPDNVEVEDITQNLLER